MSSTRCCAISPATTAAPAAFLVYLWLAGERDRRKQDVSISYQELAESTGLSRSSAQSAVMWLVRRKLLVATKANATSVPRYTVLSPWRKRPVAR